MALSSSEWTWTAILALTNRVYYDRDVAELKVGDAFVHPNHHSIYDIVGKLGVTSVFEVGCGGGDHLRSFPGSGPGWGARGADRMDSR